MKIKTMLKRNEYILNTFKSIRYFYFKNFFSDEGLIRYRFRKSLGREVELENPTKFNDKLQWLKLYWYDPLAIKCADKYNVRDFVKERIGDKYLNKLYAVYDTVDEINIDKLPKSFVLKATHGSGDNIICTDKNNMNWEKVLKKLRKSLKKNLYWTTREWVYKDIEPKIICEKYLSEENGKPPSDYKIFCFNGEPKLIQVDSDRFGVHRQNFYTTDWELKNVDIGITSKDNIKIEKPETLGEMLELSRKLSKGFPHVRVDFYSFEGNIIFGELTFFHRSGFAKFEPPEFEEEMGDYLQLPN